ncbi:MAG TPA: hypothetical protein VGD80_11795 [Kofleriaceae bacterium]
MTVRALPLALAAAIAVLGLRAAPVDAQPDRAARQKAAAHFKQGQAFFQVGDYDHALVEYQAALDLSAEPSLVFNIALCHDRANRPEQALDAFRHFLELAPDSAVADEAREDIARLTPIVEKIRTERAERAEQARLRAEEARRTDAAQRVEPPPAPRPPSRPPSRAPLYVMAAGAAIAAGGGVMHLLAWRARDQAAHAPDADTHFARRDTLERDRAIAIGAYAAGAATIAIGVVLRYTVFRRAEGPQLSVTVMRDGAGVAMEWAR